MADECVVEAAGRAVAVSSPEKVFFAERGETKLDLVRYYLAVATPLMRATGGRPALMQRFPQGAGGPSFFQKRVPESAPDWLHTTIVSTPNGTTSRALVLADPAHVVWAVNLACLGFHVWPYLHDRDLTGFIDGTENPNLIDAPELVLIPDGKLGAGGITVVRFDRFTDLVLVAQQALRDLGRIGESGGRADNEVAGIGDMVGPQLAHAIMESLTADRRRARAALRGRATPRRGRISRCRLRRLRILHRQRRNEQ